MYRWKFKQYKAWTGRRAICDWKKRLTPSRRAIFDAFMDRIAKMNTWPLGICDPLKNHAGCWELRWQAEKVQHRIFGYFGAEREFIMLVGCTHKGRIYDPPAAFTMLDERKKQIEGGTAEKDEYSIFRSTGRDA